MGGFGSGRHAGQVKDTVEDSRFLKASWVKVQAEENSVNRLESSGTITRDSCRCFEQRKSEPFIPLSL